MPLLVNFHDRNTSGGFSSSTTNITALLDVIRREKKSKITLLSCQLKIVLIEEVNKVSDSRSENDFVR